MATFSHEIDTTIEVERNGEIVEVELTMHYDVASPEPDVGLFGYGVDEYEFTLADGSPLPEDVQKAVDDKPESWLEGIHMDAVSDVEPYDPGPPEDYD